MAVNSIRTELILGTRNFVSGAKEGYKSIQQLQGAFKGLDTQVRQTKVTVDGLNTTLVNMSSAIRSFERFENVFTNIIGGAYEYNKVLETNAVGIAGVLTAMVKVNDKELEWNQSMAMSADVMSKLRKEALRTSSTAPELIGTFSGLLGIGLGAKMSIDEMIRFTTVGVNAVKSMGLNGTQLIQELRGLLQGGIRASSSTLATALGLKDKDIKAAKESSEGLFKFLMKRLEGFDKSVEATSKTVQGRLDIMKEGFYQGVGEGAKGLWQDFSHEIEMLSKNFLVRNEELKTVELNPKFVSQVRSVSDTIRSITGFFSGTISGATSDASSILKAMILGIGLKISTGAFNSIINFATNGAKKFRDMESGLSLVGKGLNSTVTNVEKWGQQQQFLNEILVKSTSEIYNLSKHYRELGVSAEQATKWQNMVVNAINNGASVEKIREMVALHEQLALNMKKAGTDYETEAKRREILNKAEIENLKEREALEKSIAELRSKANKGLTGAIGAGVKNARDSKNEIAKLASGKNNENSLYAYEQAVLKSDQRMWGEKFTKEQAILLVKQAIWKGDYANAFNLINTIKEQIGKEKEILQNKDLRLQQEKEIAKAQKDQYQWLMKQVEANVKLENAKPKFSEEERRYNLLKRTVRESIADNKSAQKEAKLSKDALYVQNWLNGKTKSKAFTPENAGMVNDLIAKMQEAGFSQAKAYEMAKTFINQLQSAKVGTERIKEIYETTAKELGNIKERYAEIKAEGDKIFSKAMDAGFAEKQAQKMREAYVKEMTNGSRESAQAWRKAFDENIEHSRQIINGVMRGTSSTATQSATPKFSPAEQLAHAQKELEFNYKATMQFYEKVNQEAFKKINEAINNVKKAQKDNLLTAEEASKLELEFTKKVADGYMEEALAIAKVIEEQYKNGTLAEENAKKQRDLEATKAKEIAVNNEIALTLERIAQLNGNVLQAEQRNAIQYATIRAMEGKGYNNSSKALKELISLEEKMAQEIQKTGQVAPPVYNEILEAIVKLTKAERDLTKEELDQIKALVEKGKVFTKLGENVSKTRMIAQSASSAFMGLGMTLSYCGLESESTAGRFAEWAIQVGFLSSSVLGLVDNLKELWAVMKGIGLAKGGALLAGGGKVLGAIGASAFGAVLLKLHQEGIDVTDTEKLKQVFGERLFAKSQLEIDKMREQADLDQFEQDYGMDYGSRINGNITLKNPPSTGGGGGSDKGAKRLQEQADKAKRSYDELIASINVANAKFDTDSDSFAKKQAEINKQITQWQNKLDEAKSKGNFTEKEIENANNLIAKYRELAEAENDRNKQKQWYADELQRTNNLQAMGILTDNEVNVRRIGTLSQEIDFLKQMLPLYKNNAEGRLQIETDIAQKIKAIREAELTDGTVHWDRVLEHIRNTSYNLTETINSGVSGMFDSIANFGQNLLTESKSLSQRFKDLFKGLANDLMNMMMKVIMRGLIMNAILGIGGNGKYYTKGELDPMKVTGAKIGTRAKGGLASGWNIVGENGPELVNFSNPARVYTAQQTRNALNASGGNVNIKIDLKNESGQELQAEQTGSTFDGENYVLGIVLKAMQTNKGGIRTTMKGLVNT